MNMCMSLSVLANLNAGRGCVTWVCTIAEIVHCVIGFRPGYLSDTVLIFRR